MKKFLLVGLAAFSSAVLFGQAQLENPGFEGTWETGGDINGSEPEPIDWSSLKSADALASFAPIVAFQESTDPHSGTYCIRLLVVNSFGVNAAGLLTNGRVHADFNPENGYVYTIPADNQYNYAFTDRPDSLVFWVKHAPQGSDKSKMEVILHDDTQTGQLPHDGTTSHWVGKARIDVTTTIGNWTRMSAPFEYYNNNSPDYILATMAAGDSTIAVEDTEMWVDDIELIYNPLSVAVSPSTQQTFDACVNGPVLTANEMTNAGVTSPVTREWKWSTTMGGPYSSFGIPETGASYTPLFTTVGTYYIVCESDFGSQGVITSNEVELVVTSGSGDVVSISPTANQNINEAQDGTDLTATECPTTSTRDWKWTTTSGSGYQSFSPVETGATYTPNFAAAGTYYVICESDFTGNMVNSNEVTIIVAPAGTGIDEHGISFNIFNTGSFVQVEFESTINEAFLEIYTLDGKRIYNSVVTNGVSQHNFEASKGIYVYRLINGDKIVTGQINL